MTDEEHSRKMVECYGPDWETYQQPHECPHCRSDLRDLENGPPFKREVGVYDMYLDRTVFLMCPDCHGKIDRLGNAMYDSQDES